MKPRKDFACRQKRYLLFADKPKRKHAEGVHGDGEQKAYRARGDAVCDKSFDDKSRKSHYNTNKQVYANTFFKM